MTRRKGELTRAQIDRNWPHQVEFVVPPRGLGNQLNILARGAAEADATYRSYSRTVGVDHCMRFCFATRESAEGFRERFGGLVVGQDAG